MTAVTDIPATHRTTREATREAELALVMALCLGCGSLLILNITSELQLSVNVEVLEGFRDGCIETYFLLRHRRSFPAEDPDGITRMKLSCNFRSPRAAGLCATNAAWVTSV